MNLLVSSSPAPRAHPPRSNPFLRSSDAAPFPCITPSRVTWVMVVSFMIAVPLPWRRPWRAASPLLRTPPPRSATASRTSLTYFPGRRSRLGQDLDVAVGAVHADLLAIADQPGGVLHPDDGRQAVLPGDPRAMGHQASHLRHQALDRDERRRPAGVGVGGDQDVARFELRLGHVPNDASPAT